MVDRGACKCWLVRSHSGYRQPIFSSHSADPYEDQFEKKATARKEQIAKNDYQRLRNISRAGKSGSIKGDWSFFCLIV